MSNTCCYVSSTLGFPSKDRHINIKSYTSASFYPYGCSQDECRQPCCLTWQEAQGYWCIWMTGSYVASPKSMPSGTHPLCIYHSSQSHSELKKEFPSIEAGDTIHQLFNNVTLWNNTLLPNCFIWLMEGKETRGAIEGCRIFIHDTVCSFSMSTMQIPTYSHFYKTFFSVNSRPGRQQGPWKASKGEHCQAVVRPCRWFTTEPKPWNLVLHDQNFMPFDCCFLFSDWSL